VFTDYLFNPNHKENIMNRLTTVAISAAFAASLMACGNGNTINTTDPDEKPVSSSGTEAGVSSSAAADTDSGISYETETSGTLRVINNTNKDMVLFQGQTPQASNVLGGVRALSERYIDVSDDVSDFAVGGYMVVRGMTADEYAANKSNLSAGKVEYSSMATYAAGKKFSVEISSNNIGDYGFKVTNLGRIGMELRKGSPDGEKVSYLPSLATNNIVYSATTDAMSLFPVYVFYDKSTQTITTLKATSHFESVTATPRPLTGSSIPTFEFPNDPNVTWETIVGMLTSPVAYVTITNNVPNQGSYFTAAGSNALKAQNGYDALGPGEQLTFEIQSSEEGTQKSLTLNFYNGAIKVPVQFAEQETTYPVLKNGYDYEVMVSGAGQEASGYTATLVEKAKRDLSDQIESL
jgi:hypothetical protein